MAGEKSMWTGLKRGIARRCPNCGEGRLFTGYIKVRAPCEVCGADNTIYPSDDLPPYLAIFAAGHILVPLFMWSDRAFMPPVWVQCAIWLPAAAVMTLAMLPFAKGAAIGICWAYGLVRPESAT